MKTDTEKTTTKTALRFPTGVINALRRAVLHAQHKDPQITMTSVIARGIALAVEELEAKYGRAPKGEAGKLRVGRRMQQ